MRVLIIGGAGLIGSHIARELVVRNDEVIVLDALVNYVSPFDKDYKITEEVLTRRWSIRELLRWKQSMMKPIPNLKLYLQIA